MGPQRPRPVVLDSGALIAFEGVMCGSTGTADVVDASVALVARRQRALVVTSDPGDISQFGADIECIVC